MEELIEFAQVSLFRYEALIEQKHSLEMRVQELENYINEIERFLLHACEDAKYDWVTIDAKDIKRLIYRSEENE